MADDDSTPKTKTCTKCSETKAIEALKSKKGEGISLAIAGPNVANADIWRGLTSAEPKAGHGTGNIENASLARNKAWRAAHPEQVQALNKDYQETHQEERRLYFQQWSQEHRRRTARIYAMLGRRA